jgi:hypothetical protein
VLNSCIDDNKVKSNHQQQHHLHHHHLQQQQCSTKFKSTTTNMVICLNIVGPLCESPGQFDSVFFDKVLHSLLLDKVSNYGLFVVMLTVVIVI